MHGTGPAGKLTSWGGGTLAARRHCRQQRAQQRHQLHAAAGTGGGAAGGKVEGATRAGISTAARQNLRHSSHLCASPAEQPNAQRRGAARRGRHTSPPPLPARVWQLHAAQLVAPGRLVLHKIDQQRQAAAARRQGQGAAR